MNRYIAQAQPEHAGDIGVIEVGVTEFLGDAHSVSQCVAVYMELARSLLPLASMLKIGPDGGDQICTRVVGKGFDDAIGGTF